MTTATQVTNKMEYNINCKDADGNNMEIEVRLSDESRGHNGHETFAITATAYQKGKPKTDKYFIYGGCSHEEILKVRKDLKIFVDLHLADAEGIPMYAVENGFYHLTEGFNSTKPDSPEFKTQFCEYYRVTPEQFDVLVKCENKLRYAIALEKLGILKQWKQEADKAIKILEEYTGKTFESTATKPNYTPVKPEQIQKEEQKEVEGYYTDAKIEERKQAAISAAKQKVRDRILKERDADIKKANDEYNVQTAVLDAGMNLDNFIYYNHVNQGAFNWNTSTYNPEVTQEQFNDFLSKVNTANCPEGITFKLK